MTKTTMYPASQMKRPSWDRNVAAKSASSCAINDEKNLQISLEVGGVCRGYRGETVLDTMMEIVPNLPVLIAGAIEKATRQGRYLCDKETFDCFARLGWDRAAFTMEREKMRAEGRVKVQAAKHLRSA